MMLLTKRSSMSPELHAREAAALVERVAAVELGRTTCCYVPVGQEPGTLDLIEALRRRGTTVLLPVVPEKVGPLHWAAYEGAGSLRGGRLRGLLEPDTPDLGPTAIATATTILIPALAVDFSGARLGRGGGYYDRSLQLRQPTARLVAVVRDSELVEHLPAEPHDVRMTGVLTPDRGLLQLPFPKST